MKKIHLFGGIVAGSAAGVVAGVLAGAIAGITLKYLYDKYIHEKQIHKKLTSTSIKDLKKTKKCLLI